MCLAIAIDDEACGDRRAVVVQHRLQLRGVDLLLGDDQRAQLRVAVLLDDEDGLVRDDERIDRGAERERPHAQRVDVHALGLQRVERLVHRRAGRAEVHHAVACRLRGSAGDRLRHERLRGLELLQQPLHVVHVVGARLRIARVGVAGRAAREVRALVGVRAG